MATLRRALFRLLAATALMFGFGMYTAALACPATIATAEDHSDCCGQGEQQDCVLLSCTAICHAIPAVVPNGEPDLAFTNSSFWGNVRALEAANMGPEPPPPRFALQRDSKSNSQWRTS